MLYVFHGNDTETGRKKAAALIDSLRTKKPDAAYDTIDADNWNISLLESHLGGQGLFSNKYIIFLNRVTDNDEAGEIIADYVPALKESSNIFIAHFGKLKAALKKVIVANAEKVVECELAEKKFAKKDFNIFALGDAMGQRDPVKSWQIYLEAKKRGQEPESILGTLFWQTKAIWLASQTKNATEAGLNPFVFSNCEKFARNFTPQQIHLLTREIVRIYHDSHRGRLDAEIGIETFLLSLTK